MTPIMETADPRAALGRLRALLAGLDQRAIAIAVSGGIDSLTLSAAAAPVLGARLTLHHATSPAVPAEATERTRAVALKLGTSLVVFDAGEFDDARYRANPVNRCFYCKTNLYGAIATRLRGTGALILSGTNTDDLNDDRPGLQAADRHRVRHPFVEAAISKATLRQIAPLVGLDGLADLPSAPCLSSRVETGLPIEPATLALVHAIETAVAAQLGRHGRVVRCRVRRDGLVLELDPLSLEAVRGGLGAALRRTVADLVAQSGEAPRALAFAPYRTGSAVLRAKAAAPQPARP